MIKKIFRAYQLPTQSLITNLNIHLKYEKKKWKTFNNKKIRNYF